MCGIAGFIGSSAGPEAHAKVGRMVGALARRGPDGEGIESWPNAVLGHRRLAIFDLTEAGRQPMVSADAAVGVVFNGSIYNFRQLRSELAPHYEFVSDCDTEVLLHGYREWGIDGLVARLRGMFAFAIWDERTHRLFLVRDRLGVKPLVFTRQGNWIAFASTVGALNSAGLCGDIDEQAVLDVLEFGWVTDQRSIFTGVEKVPPGTILEWTVGPPGTPTMTQRTYWTVPDTCETGLPFPALVERTEELLLESVKLRLDADVRVGALLSGGIDSALVCWAMAKLNADITAFTVSTPGEPEDEADDAREIARHLGIRHEIVEMRHSDELDIAALVSAYAEPFACGSALAMLRVARAVRTKATVLLTGDGGDDVFLGYPRHRHMWAAQRLARLLPEPFARVWPSVRDVARQAPFLRRPVHFLDYSTGGLGAYIHTNDGIPYFTERAMFGERLLGRSPAERSVPPAFESARQGLKDVLSFEHRTRFLSEYMVKVDGATMFHALEARSPFLDHELWEFAARIPYGQRLVGGELKSILRALARKRVSPRIGSLRKRGFSVPVERRLAGASRAYLTGLLDGGVLESGRWLRRDPLEAAIRSALRTGSIPHQLWRTVVLERWLAVHCNPAAEPTAAAVTV